MSIRHVSRWLGVVLLAACVGVAGVALTPRAACACTTKQKTYGTQMKAELRNLVTAQEGFFSDSLRYASREELAATNRWNVLPAIQLISLTHSDSTWRARVQHRDVAGMQCWIAAGNVSADEVDGEPQCDPFPRGPIASLHYQTLALYALFYLAALAIRFTRAGHGLPPIRPQTYLGFFLLATVHPFWIPMRTSRSCLDGIPMNVPAVITMGVLMAWMLVRREDWKKAREQP